MTVFKTSRLMLLSLVGVPMVCACSQLTIAFDAKVPAGVTAEVDVEQRIVRLSQGAVLSLSCTEYTETYDGPCRDIDVEVEHDSVAELLLSQPNRSVAGGGETFVAGQEGDHTVTAVTPTRNVVMLGLASGETNATLSTESSSITFAVEVVTAN